MLAEQSMLGDLVQHGMGYKKHATTVPPPDNKEMPSAAAASSGVKKNGGGGSKSSSSSATGQPSAVAAAGNQSTGGLTVRSRKKKKKYAESESDWSDDEVLLPVNRGGSGNSVTFNFDADPVSQFFMVMIELYYLFIRKEFKNSVNMSDLGF